MGRGKIMTTLCQYLKYYERPSWEVYKFIPLLV